MRDSRVRASPFFSLNSYEGYRIKPPWIVLESQRIKSPALHLTRTPLFSTINGSVGVSYTKSPPKKDW